LKIAKPGKKFADRKGPEIGEGESVDLEAEGLGLEAFAAAGGAGGVRAVAREEHADMHLVGLGFEPVEEAFDAIPCARLPEGFEGFHVGRVAG
jgi:hypothetical protein